MAFRRTSPRHRRRSGPACRPYALALALALLPGLASAYDYGRPIEGITSDDDLYELYAVGDLSEEETERLVNLFEHKLDVNKARAEELYSLPGVTMDLARAIVTRRDRVGLYKSVEELASVTGMTPEVLHQIGPFIQAKVPIKLPITGSARLKSSWSRGISLPYDAEDVLNGQSGSPTQLGLNTLPETYLRLRTEVANRVKVGLVAGVEEGVSSFTYYPDHEVFTVNWGRPLFRLASGYVLMDESTWTAIAGAYAVGFGQHLVFDESRRLNPNGIYLADEIYGSSSISVPQRLLGVAATYRGFKIGPNTLELTGWVSRRRNDVSLYDFLLPNRSADGLSNEARICLDDTCTELTDTNKLYSISLPNVYTETLAGAHATLRVDKRTYLGLTGYWSFINTNGIDLDFKAGLPTDRQSFGAIGLDFGAALWKFQLDGEYALMDNLSQAFYLRSILDIGPGELFASFRTYGTDFDNPHSRGIAATDTLEQDTDRDETGFLVRGTYRFAPWLSGRVSYDQWFRHTTGVWRNAVSARLDFVPIRYWDVGLMGTWRDKDLAARGRSRNYDTASDVGTAALEDTLDTETVASLGVASDEGDGARGTIGGQISTSAVKGLWFDLYYKRTYQDAELQYYTLDCSQPYAWLVGQDGSFKVRVSPFKGGTAAARVRYVDEDVYGAKGSRAVEGYLQWTQRFRKKANFSLRYTLTRDLTGHSPTELDYYCAEQTGITLSEPEPASERYGHAVWLSAEMKF